MFAKKTISAILVVALCTLVFAGCGRKSAVKYSYDGKVEIKTVSSQVLAENGKLKMSWDDDKKGIFLEDKTCGKVWTNVPDGKDTSTLDLYVQNMQIFQTEYVSSLDALKAGKVSAKKTDNGIELTYYFDKFKISIPVTYTLRETSMLMSIDCSKIQEGGKQYRIVSAAPSSHITSIKKNAKNSYMFTSDGLGAIIDINQNSDGERKSSTGNTNVSALATTSDSNDSESTGIRAFGLKYDKDALFGIAEDTAGAVSVRFSAGDTKSKNSSIYPEFIMVDSDYTKGKAVSSPDVRLLSDRLQSVVSVGYYPLSGKDANYNGMANCYRNYLTDSGFITDEERDFSSPYAVTALGGVMSTSSILGVPVSTLKSATTFAQAKNLISKITEETGTKPVVRLKGYGTTGLNIGKLAGGYKFASIFGSDKDRMAVENYCKDQNMPFYFDFDLVRYAKSGNGFSHTNDAAKTATLHTAEFSGVNVPLRDSNSKLKYRLLSRSKISKAVDKLIDFANDDKISGVCLSFFGSKSYSDYSDIKYAVTGLMDTDVKTQIEKIKKSGTKVSGSASAYYSAGLVETVFEAPLEPMGRYQFKKEIPFYQMVFAGITPLYSAPINTASNPNEKIMLAASSGTGLGFSMIEDFENEYMESGVEKLYACGYDYCSSIIKDSLSKYEKIYNKVAGSKITDYQFIDKNVTKTVFENGTVVYANHSSGSVNSPAGKLGAYGFMMEGGK
ncbi:MAG: DUF5696 domain-containing protein [Clostridia bacterium]|nr:DUF5696 domain-containing protein [Clostridia bacterium]